MTNLKKKIAIAVLAVCLFVSGIVGISVVNADSQNWLAVRYGDKQVSAYLGENAALADVLPVYPDKVERIMFSVEGPDGNVVGHDGETFEITQVGNYSVYVCVVGKDGKTYVETYSISATKSEKPIVTNAPVMPVAFLEGSAYDAPEAVFTDYNTQTPTVVDYDVYFVDENGSENLLAGRINPAVTLSGSKVSLKYVAKSSVTNQETVLEYFVPVLKCFTDGEDGYRLYDYDKMFVVEGVESSATTTIGATFYGKSDFSFEYANNVHSSFGFTMKSLEGYTNYSSVIITVADALDKSCYHTFEVTSINDTSSLVQVNEDSNFTVSGSLKNFGSGFVMSYNDNDFKLTDSSSALITQLRTTANGVAFKGFKSGFVTIKVEVKGVTADSAVAMTALNTHSFTRANRYDMISPYIIPSKELSIKNGLNQTIVVPKALAYDVVDPDVYAGVSVFDPTGEVVTAVDGTLLYEAPADKEYEIVLSSIGEYTLQYFASDASDNSYDYGYYTVYAVDKTAPVLTMKGYVKSEVKVGEEVTIPEFDYSDNITSKENLKIWISISVPGEMSYRMVEMGDKFKFEMAGTYYVRYSVIDEFYNITTVEQIIVCK